MGAHGFEEMDIAWVHTAGASDCTSDRTGFGSAMMLTTPRNKTSHVFPAKIFGKIACRFLAGGGDGRGRGALSGEPS
jgi:hypothetical protein